MKKLKNNRITLSDIPNDNAFRVPEGYFDTFPERLMSRMDEQKSLSVFNRVVQFIRPQLALAGGLLLFVLIGYIGFNFLLNHRPDNQVLTNTTINSVLEADPAFIDEYTLIDVVDEDQMTSTNQSNNDEYGDQVAEYLMDHNVEMATLVEQL